MVGSERFHPNSPRVIGEVIDDEAILIDLETGSYFSLVGSGALIWSAIEHGATVDEMVAALDAVCGGVPSDAGLQVAAFVGDLRDSHLIVAGASAAPAVPPPAPAGPISSAGPHTFEPPAITRFDDMQELILLDPIHEVDPSEGWPRAKSQAPSPE
jgi:hypothetical protein